MCIGCWEKHGSPKIVNEKTTAAVDLIRAVYDANSVGGNLNIVLDDFNVEDLDLEACRVFIDTYDDNQYQWYCDAEAERACLNALLAMTVEERVSALAMYDGYFDAAVERGEA